MVEIKSHAALRGIAALLVVIYHFRVNLRPVFDVDLYTQFFAKGYLWVDCFFMLSGFILSHVYGTNPGENGAAAKGFFLARFARIYPLHIATLLFLTALFLARTIDANWYTFFLNVIGIHAWGFLNAYDWNFPSWSISVEFAAYIIFPIVCLCLVRAKSVTIGILTAAALASLTIGRDHWERMALLHGLPMFLAGIVLYQIPRLPYTTFAQCLSIAILFMALHFGWTDATSEICFALLIYSMQYDDGLAKALIARPFLELGAWSYSIYMLHIPTRIFVEMFSGKMGLGTTGTVVLALALTMALGAASYRYFELPTRKWLRQNSRRTVATAN